MDRSEISRRLESLGWIESNCERIWILNVCWLFSRSIEFRRFVINWLYLRLIVVYCQRRSRSQFLFRNICIILCGISLRGCNCGVLFIKHAFWMLCHEFVWLLTTVSPFWICFSRIDSSNEVLSFRCLWSSIRFSISILFIHMFCQLKPIRSLSNVPCKHQLDHLS